MSRNIARIRTGIKALTERPYEIISGKVVAGSTDSSQLTISVQPSDDSKPIEGIMMNTIIANGKSVVIYPKEGSNVVIGSIDGPGAWTLIKADEITKATITIGNVVFEMDETQVNINNNQVVLNMSDSVFTVKTESESLYKLLKDCFTYITQLTVPTPAGVSGVPTNASSFSTLQSRLDNLLNE